VVSDKQAMLQGSVSTVICNHTGFTEILALVLSPLHPAFTPSATFKNTILGGLAKGLQSIFINRESSLEGRNRTVEIIMRRQKNIEEEGMPFSPITIFAEGTTSNGKSIMKFKRGGFVSLRPVQPCFIKLSSGTTVRPSYDVLAFECLAIMFLCTLWPTFCTLYIMPVFRPTQWMIDNHKEKGEKEWEIYAECVRDAMCKAGGFPRFKD
jgi:1-acyl-sn-glycerol-3-phosphate acyltransferase